MISYGIGRCVGLLFSFCIAFCMAGRSTPMTGANQSNYSCRILLFLFVLLGMPILARCDSLEDSAKELAQKIAGALTSQEVVAIEVRNLSSLTLSEAAQVEQTLKSELSNRGVHPPSNGSVSGRIVVTLSENVKSQVWTAEIRQGDESRTVLLVVPHSNTAPSSPMTLPVLIGSERFWVGPQRIVDAATTVAPNGDQLVVALVPDALVIRNVREGSEIKIDVPLGISTSELREPTGTLSLVGNSVDVQHGPRICKVSLDTHAVIECQDFHGETRPDYAPSIKGGKATLPAPTNCTGGRGMPWFVTGTGDDTQSDFLEIVAPQDLESTIVSNQLNFPGPVLAIHGGTGDSPFRAIVKNLRTGNYEAYRLSISCGQ